MKGKYFFIFFAISLIASLFAYLLLENLFISIGVVVVYCGVCFAICIPIIKKHNSLVSRYHECSLFEKRFIAEYGLKLSVTDAFNRSLETVSFELLDQLKSLSESSEIEKLEYLKNYFLFRDYQLFYQFISTNQISIDTSCYLMDELNSKERYLNKRSEIAKKKYYESCLLWVLALTLLIFMRFCLQDFYLKIKSQILFIISVCAILGLVLISMFFLIKKCTNIDAIGYIKDENTI